MKPHKHADASLHRYGPGRDYQALHDFMDMTKMAYPGMQHRHVLHNDLGIRLAGMAFGEWAVEVACDHVLEDLGRVPSAAECESLCRLPVRAMKLLRGFAVSDDARFVMEMSPLLHNSVGPFVVERLLGPESRQSGEDFVLELYGYIPSLHEVVHGTPIVQIDRAAGTTEIKRRLR